MAAVFDNYEAMRAFVDEVKVADLGISVNISAPMDAAERCCQETGIQRHSVEYSLGFRGRLDKLPDANHAGAVDHVRPRHGVGEFCNEDGRVGKGEPSDSRGGRHATWPASASAASLT